MYNSIRINIQIFDKRGTARDARLYAVWDVEAFFYPNKLYGGKYMTKKLQITLLSVLAALLCVALVFGGVSLAPKAQAATTSEDGTTVTFDQESDFTVNSSNQIDLTTEAKAMITDAVTHVNVIFPANTNATRWVAAFIRAFGDRTVSLTIPASMTSLYNISRINAVSIKVAADNETLAGVEDGSCVVEKATKTLLWTTGNISEDPDFVTGIDSGVISGATSLHIPANITSIASDAIDYTTLETLTVDAANSVYTDANANCLIEKENGKLVMVTKGTTAIPEEVKIIAGGNTFGGIFTDLGLTEIVIPNTVEQIGSGAFNYCAGLQKLSIPFVGTSNTSGDLMSLFRSAPPGYADYFPVSQVSSGYLPKSLTEINITGENVVLHQKALYGLKNTNVTKVTVPDSVTLDGSDVIDFDGKFLTVDEETGHTYLGNDTNTKVILVKSTNTDITLQIPEGVRVINENVFKNGSMVEVVLPSTLKQICANAFDGCTDIVSVYNLSSLDIQKGSEEHGKVALYANSVYTEFNGSKIDSTTIEGYTFIADDIPVLYRYTGSDTNITLPANYNGKRYNIADNAFNGNTTVTDVVIPTLSALNIGESAFEGCISLKSIVINDLENSIGKAAFKGCTALTSITFANCHITEIADEAFMNCSSLLEIAVPESVTTIGTSAFEECTSAVAITLGNKVEYIGGKAFANTASLKTATIPDSVTELGYGGGPNEVGNPWKRDYVFAGSGIESVYIGSGLQYMGNTFSDCVNLKEISFSQNSSLKNISYAFVNCTALTTLTIPEGVINAQYALNGVTNLTSLYIPYSLVNVTSTASADLTTRYSDMSLRSTESPYPEYAHLTMYLPDLPKDATADEIDAFARKLAVFAVYSDYSSIDTYVMGNSQFNVNTVFANQVTVLSKEAYDAVHKVLSDTSDGNLYSTFTTFRRYFSNYEGLHREDILSHFYYVADVTYELYKQMSDGSTKLIDSETVKKLANNEGADIRYVLMTDKYGSKYYAIDESYAMPSLIGATSATGEWKVGSIDGDAFVLDGAKINGANKFVNVLGEDAKLEITVDDEYTATYNGEEWTLPASLADKATITSVNGVAGAAITNAGTYTVVITAGADYQFADGSNTATVTVVINKANAELVWTYVGNKLSADEVLEKTFDGKAIKSKLVITYVDAKGVTQTIDLDHISRTLNGTATMGDAVGAGDWVLYLSDLIRNAQYPNYVFEHASQSFRINNVQLSSSDVLNGTVIDLVGVATLNDGMLYIYEDNSHNIIPSRTPMAGYTLVEVINVQRSIVRFTNREWTLAATVKDGNADKFAVNGGLTAGSTQTAIGRQTTTFVLNAKDNYEFASSINGGVAERGLTFTVSEGGKTLTVTKTWYVVQLANELVKADYTGTDEPADSDLYTVANWTFGQNVSFALPKLWHGSDADNANRVKFTLNKQGEAEAIVSGAARADLLKYLNKYMPAGDYVLTFTVEAFDTADASYPTFSRIYEFAVAKAAIVIDETKLPKNETTGYANYDWELAANANKALFFKTFADKITASGVLQTVVMNAPADTFWATEKGQKYFGEYEVKYNFARMNNEEYNTADNNYLYEYISGGARGTYTVYFQIEMPNHENLTDVGEEGRYAYFFTVVVYETVDPADIHVENVTYTGLRNLPALAETDVYHVEYDGNDKYIDGGEHQFRLVLNDGVHYRWKGVAVGETGLTVKYTINKALNEFVEAPDIVRWVEGKFNEEENGFIGAAKFGAISYVVTDIDDNVIFDLSQNIDNRASMKAGTYILKATVAGNDSYSGLTQSFTIRILEKIGLPWWGTTLVVVGSLGLAAAIILILWKLKVFEILTDKISLAITTRATVDATIAAVRANKKAEEAEENARKAKARERLEAAREAYRNKTPEQRAEELAAKAEVTATKADRLHARANKMRERADRLAGKAEQSDDAQDSANEQIDDTSSED